LICLILFNCYVTKPSQETGKFKATDLEELVKLDTSIRLAISYASSNNLEGRPVYKEARAFLQWPAAEALAEGNND